MNTILNLLSMLFVVWLAGYVMAIAMAAAVENLIYGEDRTTKYRMIRRYVVTLPSWWFVGKCLIQVSALHVTISEHEDVEYTSNVVTVATIAERDLLDTREFNNETQVLVTNASDDDPEVKFGPALYTWSFERQEWDREVNAILADQGNEDFDYDTRTH